MAVIIPNTVFEYTIDSDGTFPNRRVDIPSFTEEIQSSAITVPLIGITIVGGNCRIEFATNANNPPGLTDAEIAILEGLVTSHMATPRGPPDSLPYIWQVKNPLASIAQTVLNVFGLANSIDEYKMMRPSSLIGVNMRLKSQLTAGSLTVTISKNGVATNKSFTFDSTKPKFKLMILAPGKLDFEKGDSLGFMFATDVGFLPLTNELDITAEVAWAL